MFDGRGECWQAREGGRGAAKFDSAAVTSRKPTSLLHRASSTEKLFSLLSSRRHTASSAGVYSSGPGQRYKSRFRALSKVSSELCPNSDKLLHELLSLERGGTTLLLNCTQLAGMESHGSSPNFEVGSRKSLGTESDANHAMVSACQCVAELALVGYGLRRGEDVSVLCVDSCGRGGGFAHDSGR